MDLAPLLIERTQVLCGEIVASDAIALRVEMRSVRLTRCRAACLELVFTELMRNALLHAYAPGIPGHVGAFLWRAGSATRLAVADGGPGMALERGAGGIARARAALGRIGGGLLHEPGSGTVWRAVVPDSLPPWNLACTGPL